METINTTFCAEDVDSLVVHPRNPRVANLPKLIESIRSNGFYGALVVQRSSRRVLAGNHRLIAARELGAKTVPVVWVDCDDARADRILLADNRINDLAFYDDELLLELLGEHESLEGTGWTDDDLTDLIAYTAGTELTRGQSGGDELGANDLVRAKIVVLCGVEDREMVYRAIQGSTSDIDGVSIE